MIANIKTLHKKPNDTEIIAKDQKIEFVLIRRYLLIDTRIINIPKPNINIEWLIKHNNKNRKITP